MAFPVKRIVATGLPSKWLPAGLLTRQRRKNAAEINEFATPRRGKAF
jgi:hypothetical protein